MSSAPTDGNRQALYDDLHHRQLKTQRDVNEHSAERILSELFAIHRPTSVLDVGCGLGTWLAVCRKLGVDRVRGVDGPWLDENVLEVDRSVVSKTDLEKPFDLNDHFDLVISLEVGEHLSESAATDYVASLVRHGSVVHFSAAIPYQGGHHHVNERWPSYWMRKFREHEFVVIDAVRQRHWHDDSILWWLRQNLLLFVRKATLESHAPLLELHRRTHGRMPLDVVHPTLYTLKLRAAVEVAQENQRMKELLSAGGTFDVRRDDEGRLHIKKLAG